VAFMLVSLNKNQPMRAIFFTLMIFPFVLQAQQWLDQMGIPVEKQPQQTYQPKFAGEDYPISPVPIIKSFLSPTLMPTGITCSGTYLYVIGYNEFKIFVVDPISGALIEEIPIDIQRPYGIDYQDDKLYVIDNDNKLLEIILLDGTVEQVIPLANPVFPVGICVDGDSYWMNDTKGTTAVFSGDSTLNFDINTNELRKAFPAYANFPTGIVSDGDFMWITDNTSQSTFKISKGDYAIVDRIQAPGGSYPNGLSICNMGLWYVNNATDSIYLVEVITTGENTPDLTKECALYPNPNSGVFTISWEDEIPVMNFKMYSLTGAMVLNKNVFRNEQLICNELFEGIYIGELSDGKNSKKTMKVIINK